MPKRTDIHKIMVIGSGPIIIGQAAEFDYSGTQACLALKELGYEVILVNSNPATIMTDKEIADKVYLEPITLQFVSQILRKEKPEAILPTLGGQQGLNMAAELSKVGILQEMKIELLGTDLSAINQAEDRGKFKALMKKLDQPTPSSKTAQTVSEALLFAKQKGFPVIVRPAYTMGGTGGGIAKNEKQLKKIAENGLHLSPVTQILVEQSIAGYKEIEFEVMRDAADNALVVCNLENFDPVGIHTGDSIVYAPIQTLSDREIQMLRDASLKIIRALKIEGGCNVQLALDPKSFQYYIIEVNPRVSRSSALASKATGYPIAKMAAKIAVGLHLDEIKNPVTDKTYAEFEPALDYVVCKIPRWPFDKFITANKRLGTQMKATGEVMAIGRNIEEATLKAVRSLEINHDYLEENSLKKLNDEQLSQKLIYAEDDRLFCLMEAIRRGYEIKYLAELTHINIFFLDKLLHIFQIEGKLKNNINDLRILKVAKENGFPDSFIAKIWGITSGQIRDLRKKKKLKPVYKMVDTCAGEFDSKTPYYYSTYESENESIVNKKPSILVIGSGPIRIGQGVEFDYATVHSIQAIQKAGFEAIIINNNPETVSTDFSVSDKLYFEPLTIEDVLNVIDIENPIGVIVQFGGQTAVNLAKSLTNHDVKILGTSANDLNKAEDRYQFNKIIKKLGILQPRGKTIKNEKEALETADKIGYPVLVRPSYVLGGRAMEIINKRSDLEYYIYNAVKVSHNHPVLIDSYLLGKECEVDAICDGETVLIPGIMEHIERAGVHSGDSMAVYPPQTISENLQKKIVGYTKKLALALNCKGIINIQFIIHNNKLYVLEVNPRASRTVPFLSKITGISMAEVATKAILGIKLSKLGYKGGLIKASSLNYVKAPVFSFSKLNQVDTLLGPEMKSTGEVMGSDRTMPKALYKAFEASKLHIPMKGRILFTVKDDDKKEALNLAKSFHELGYFLLATAGTASYFEKNGLDVERVNKVSTRKNNLLKQIGTGKIQIVVNTISDRQYSAKDGSLIRNASIIYDVPLFTSLDTVKAILKVLESRGFITHSL